MLHSMSSSLPSATAAPSKVTFFTLDHLAGLPAAEFRTPERLLIWTNSDDFLIEIHQQKVLCHAGDALLLNSGRHCRLLPQHAAWTPHIDSLILNTEWIDSFNVNYNALAQRYQQSQLHPSSAQDLCLLPGWLQLSAPEFVLPQLQENTGDAAEISAQFHAQTLAHLLLNTLVNHNPQAISILCDPAGQPLAGQIRALVMVDLSRSWTIPELAQACHMSEATLRRKTTQEIGSLVNFIHEIKMLEALHLLRQSSLSITDIASELGYGSAAYFSSLFHQRFAICPRQLRKQPQSIQ